MSKQTLRMGLSCLMPTHCVIMGRVCNNMRGKFYIVSIYLGMISCPPLRARITACVYTFFDETAQLHESHVALQINLLLRHYPKLGHCFCLQSLALLGIQILDAIHSNNECADLLIM